MMKRMTTKRRKRKRNLQRLRLLPHLGLVAPDARNLFLHSAMLEAMCLTPTRMGRP